MASLRLATMLVGAFCYFSARERRRYRPNAKNTAPAADFGKNRAGRAFIAHAAIRAA